MRSAGDRSGGLNEIVEVARYAGAAVFVAVAIAGVMQYRRGSDAGGRAAAAFGALAAILVISLVIPEDSDDSLAWWFEKSVLALLLLFPFLLYWFTAAFHTFQLPSGLRLSGQRWS
jgi:succinate-acetate transporter protein